MIAWWVGVLLFFLGDMMGIIAMAILYGSWSHKEEEAEKKNRQRGNADGSGERSSRE